MTLSNMRSGQAKEHSSGRKPALSVIVPVYQEGELLETFLTALHEQLSVLPSYEIIVVNGGGVSLPQTSAYDSEFWIDSQPGRAIQMNAGAAKARAERLLFLHCDTVLPQDLLAWWSVWCGANDGVWGFFPVRLTGQGWPFRMIERMISWRSAWSKISTGDQAQFVTLKHFREVGGFQNIDLMEDVALSRALRRVAPPLVWRTPVTTSSRRWEAKGVLQTILLMWWLRFAFAIGVSPTLLARWYR